jgi:hypothetical protein
MYKKLALIFN